MSHKLARKPLSAFVICYNEEKHIRACLESLDFCDEIVVVDSFSSDATVSIAKKMGARVIQREWPGYREQKAFALTQTTHDWALNIDADERISPELRESILESLVCVAQPSAADEDLVVGYYINRLVFYLDRWWHKGGWYPEYRIRLIRKSHTKWGGVDPHEKPIVDGLMGKLSGDIYHFTYNDLNEQLNQLLKFANIAAEQDYKNGRKARWWQLIINPLVRMFRFFLLKQGFREGTAGLIVAIAEGFYTFIKYARLWELEFNAKRISSKKEAE